MLRMDSASNIFSPLDCIIFVLVAVILFGPRLPGVFEDIQAVARDYKRSLRFPLAQLDRIELLLLWTIVAAILGMITLA